MYNLLFNVAGLVAIFIMSFSLFSGFQRKKLQVIFWTSVFNFVSYKIFTREARMEFFGDFFILNGIGNLFSALIGFTMLILLLFKKQKEKEVAL